MADENTTVAINQSSGASVELEAMMKEFGFADPAAMKAAMTGYKTDIAGLKEKVKNGDATATELATLKAAQEKSNDEKLTASQLTDKKLADLQEKFNAQTVQFASEKKSNLLMAEISKVTRNSNEDEAELFADYAILKLGSAEFTNEEELKPFMDELLSRWSKLGQAQPAAVTVPEGRQGTGAATGEKQPTGKGFSGRLQRWKSGKKG